MNTITLHGKVVKDAESILVNNEGIETPLVVFSFVDNGTPYQKNKDPMFIEVHFMKEAAMHIFKYLKKGKEVIVLGCLRMKSYTTKEGEPRQKYYISADSITFTGTSSR